MLGSLHCYRSDEFIMKFAIADAQTSVGRARESDLSLPDPNISRLHFVITHRTEGYVLIDKSTNGTFINGRRALTQTLRDGDEIQAGSWRFVFHTAPAKTFADEATRIVKTSGIDAPLLLQLSETMDTATIEYPELLVSGPSGQTKRIAIPHLPLRGDSLLHYATTPQERTLLSALAVRAEGGTGLALDILPSKTPEALLAPDFQSATCGDHTARISLSSKNLTIAPHSSATFEGFQGSDKRTRALFHVYSLIAPTRSHLLLVGESGTGKSKVARTLHNLSSRKSSPFITVHCESLTIDTLEEDLLGHEQGDSTSASPAKQCLLTAADGGTVLLEHAELVPHTLLTKLSKFSQTGIFTPIGSLRPRYSTARLMLSANIRHGEPLPVRFSEFTATKGVVILALSPLRERRSDIPPICEHIASAWQRDRGHPGLPPTTFARDALDRLSAYSWPGNVRELSAVVCSALERSDAAQVTASHLPDFLGTTVSTHVEFKTGASFIADSLREDSLLAVERRTLEEALVTAGRDATRAAASLGLSLEEFSAKLAKHSIDAKKPIDSDKFTDNIRAEK